MKKLGILLLIAAGCIAYYHYSYAPEKRNVPAETAYVLSDRVAAFDTTAIIRRVVATLHSGQAVHVAARIGEWAKLSLPGGQTGWVKQSELIDAQTYERGVNLLEQAEKIPVQADGHTNAPANLHLDPSFAALKLTEFPEGAQVDVYDRRLVPRTSPAGSSKPRTDVWYLVRSGNRAGWILGRFVDLDIPSGLANYAQGINMVAWLVLDSVNDGGSAVPQYVAADRIGTREPDFNHIRVFTWWVKHHKYVTAFVESGLQGYFPITITRLGKVPYFRLRLVNDDGQKIQKVYGLFDTIVRPIGEVGGWTSDAMPAASAKRRLYRRRR
ncbi:MAG: SH3 domain-containing protein [Terriglobia bacterium]